MIPPFIITAGAEGTRFLIRIIPMYAIGIFAARVLEKTGWINRLDGLAAPVMRLGRLREECGLSFITSVVSPTAGHAMLADMRRDGTLNRQEMIICAVLNNLPGEIAGGKSVLPMAMPPLGIFGAAYYGLLLCGAILKAGVMLITGRLALDRSKYGAHGIAINKTGNDNTVALGIAMKESIAPALRSLIRACKTLIPAAYIIYLVLAAGMLDRLSGYVSVVTGHLPLNPATLSVIIARLVSPVGAYTVAGGLLAKGIATGPELVFALFAGTFLATITSIRYLIPYYCGIFGAKDGASIIGISILARTIAYGAVLFVLILLFHVR